MLFCSDQILKIDRRLGKRRNIIRQTKSKRLSKKWKYDTWLIARLVSCLKEQRRLDVVVGGRFEAIIEKVI